MKKTILLLTLTVAIMTLFLNSGFTQTVTFKKDKADLHEYVKIKKINSKKISYEVYTVNGECDEFKHKGTATLSSSNLGEESDIDANNNNYTVKEYIDKSKKCYVSIRIGSQKGYTNLARFIISDCNTLSPCKAESDILKK
jgi:hypothetical protein